MNTLHFLPVAPAAENGSSYGEHGIQQALAPKTYRLRYSEDGCFVAQPHVNSRTKRTKDVIAMLHTRHTKGVCELFLIGASSSVQVNGRRPLGLATIQPGDLLSVEGETWLVVQLWRPEPAAAPTDVADKPCPVCGGPLALAPVVRHTCGSFYHFQRPDRPHDVDALNCYVAAGACSGCAAPLALEPVVIPTQAEMMFDLEASGSIA